MLKQICLFLFIVSLANIALGQGSNAKTKIELTKPAIDQKTRLQWFRDAKFGMFIHWGVYSQTGGEWKGETNHHEWLQLTAKIPLAEYTELAKTFDPEKFDADRWVQLAKDAGMKYLVITSKHHDGFAMYNSASSGHDVDDVSKFDRDPLKELADACEKQGIRFCVYYSLGRDWEDPDVPTGRGEHVGFRSNLVDFPNESEKDFSKYFERKVKPQVRELLTGYGPIGIFWFDTYGLITKEQSAELKTLIRELQPECIINQRIGNNLGDYKVSEQKIPENGSYDPWESCITMNGHWAYNKADTDWKSAKSMIQKLSDIVSKGGNLLLNVGPTGEGLIPEPSVERLAEIGDWMEINGEAIYGCGPTPFGIELGRKKKGENGKTKIVGKLPWRATTKAGKIYIHLFEWPKSDLVLPKIEKNVNNAYLLDNKSESLKVVQKDEQSTIKLPEMKVDSLVPVLCIEFEE